MFTGIVEELGTLASVLPNATGARLAIQASTVLEDVHLGDSIAVNGCCLTVVAVGDGRYEVDVVEESLRMTSLGRLRAGDRVNLERSVRLADRLGGHLVQGHVDGVGSLVAREQLADGSLLLRFEAPPEVLRYVAYKGSIAVDGISLTVAGLDARSFSIAVIPHTQSATTLGRCEPGSQVNLEVDIIAKYVDRLLGERSGSPPAPQPSGLRLQPMVHVQDMASSVHFYEQLGAHVVHGSRDGDWVLLRLAETEIGLLAHPPNPEQNEGTVELNFQTSEPLEALEDRLRSAGVTVVQPTTNQGFGRQLQLASPDGLLLKVNELDPELYT